MSWQERMRQEIERRDNLIFDLRVKLREAIGRLETIAVGAHRTGESDWCESNEMKLQNTAASGLARIALMRERTL